MDCLRKLAVAAIVGGLAPLLSTGGAAQAATCSPDGGGGGEWPSYGQDPANSRTQELETGIGPGNVADLEAAWTFSSQGLGSFQSTPAVADGCVFLGTSTGAVFAVDADTGELVWQTTFASAPVAGGIFAPAVADGRVHVLVGQMYQPYAAALDQQTGEILWVTPLVDQHTGFVNASSVVHDGLVFAALGGRDLQDPFSRPAYFILDAETGEVRKKNRVIDEAFDDSTPPSPYGGGGIWATAAIDTQSEHLYVGTANPYSKKAEHERTNSILKVDFDPDRETFGEIVGNYKGDRDAPPERHDSTECQTLGDAQPVGYSVFCGQQDVDFGSSPNLFTDSEGDVLVGEFQKSGNYHAVDTATMEGEWKATGLAEPSVSGNSATSAYDGTAIYVATNGGHVYALDPETGAVEWQTTEMDEGSRYQPLTVANGVVYALDNLGLWYAFDTADGTVLASERLEGAGATCDTTAGGGIAVANNTVYAVCDSAADGTSQVFAYK